MTAPGCDRLTLTRLTDYAAGDVPEAEAAAIEEHLYSCADCGARAAELDALIRAIGSAVRSGELSGFVTDAILNRLAREGVRIRTFAMSPGDVVPCAVWEGDELMVIRLGGDLGGASEFTVSQRVAGTEVTRATGHVAAGPQGEILFAQPAARIRQLPVVEVEIVLTAHQGGEQRTVGTYVLLHGGSLRR